jgi:Secretion system C-terminal sorting domain
MYAGIFENYNDTSAFQIDGVTVPDYPRDYNGYTNADFFLVSFDTCASAYIDTAHSPLAIRDISGLERISIYPNPAMESCTISISNYSGGKYNVSISDMTGQELSPVFIFSDSHFTIPVSQYNQGIYLLKITAANGEETLRKLVIN